MPRTIWLAGLLALSLSACVETRPAHTNGNGGGANPPDSLDRVLSRTFMVPAFKLESGQVLPEMTLAYETYGTLAPDGRNAILVTHGFTSNHHAAGKHAVTDTHGGLVGRAHRPGQGHRHRPLLRRVVQHARLVVRIDGAAQHEPQDRQALRPRLPRHHPARYGRRPEASARRARGPAPRRRRRALVRRLSDVPVGRDVSRPS